ncbi:MAG: Rossman fold protein, TIGR00730 family [Elusimicrobia bacterium RIFCSPLOWO2_01_FULL_60_11]|nr:MAG: Rossman fold protein, TIGR00730 family [Elusimicrobia bacterium RIFCSPLOWO2_01_FULL_60_11]
MDNRQDRKSVCVFCSSSDGVDKAYYEAAAELGREISKRGLTLVYGGSDIGLMGELARTVHKGGGKVVGIIPKVLHGKVRPFNNYHELVVTDDLRHRKTLMETRSDAFIILPGGFGTLEELLEIVTLKQLGHHTKPIVIINTKSYYAPLLDMFEEMFKKEFARSRYRDLYHVCADAAGAFKYLERAAL